MEELKFEWDEFIKDEYDFSNAVKNPYVKYLKKQTENRKITGGDKMNMQETARLILGLRSAGWPEEKINDFLRFIRSGEEQYKPKADAVPRETDK